jgi:hypothetical protein
MKFRIELNDEKGKTLWSASGFADLEDACLAAHALAQRPRAQNVFIGIRSAGKVYCGSTHYFGGICCNSLENFPLDYVRQSARKHMEDLKRKKRELRERQKFLEEHGGCGGEFYRLVIPPLDPVTHTFKPGDELLRKCFFSNDFASALARFEELQKAQVLA